MKPLFKKEGFTLVEMLVFAGIFSVLAISFISVLVSVTQVHVRQTSAAEVEQQSQFVLQIIQRYVRESVLIDIDSTPQNQLRLRMSTTALDPTRIWLDTVTGKIMLQEGTAAPSALTSDAVRVASLTFQKYSNPSAKDAVDVVFAMELNTQNLARRFRHTVQTGIARVTAATFDTGLFPLSGNLEIGSVSNKWKSINNLIFFDTSNNRIGIGPFYSGAASITDILEVDGVIRSKQGVRLETAGLRPACASSLRGMLWLNQSGATDVMQVCMKTGAGNPGTYGWVNL